MHAKIIYPVEVKDSFEKRVSPVQMHIKLFPDSDFKGGNDGNFLNQLLANSDTNGDTIEIVVKNNEGREKFKLSARLLGVSTTMGTLSEIK